MTRNQGNRVDRLPDDAWVRLQVRDLGMLGRVARGYRMGWASQIDRHPLLIRVQRQWGGLQ